MARPVLSPQTREALRILADSIRAARIRRGWTEAELAERLGVSRPTVVNLEAGQPGVALGTVLEAAALVGVPLFTDDAERRSVYGALKTTELALLPKAARPRRAVDDDF